MSEELTQEQKFKFRYRLEQEQAASQPSQSQQVKDPFPYLNFFEGGRRLNKGLVEGQQTLENLSPGITESNRKQEFVKQLTGSAMMGMGAESLAGNLPGLAAKTLPAAMARSAIGGAASAQPFTYDSGMDRLKGTAIGTALGTALPAAMKVVEPLSNVNFGGKAAFRKVALKAQQALGRTFKQMSGEYSPIMDQIADKPINSVNAFGTNPLGQAISKASDVIPEGVPARQALDKIVENTQNMTAKQLHAYKADIFKYIKSTHNGVERDALRGIYDAANETLSHPSLGGQAYSDITRRYSNFMKQEVPYIAENTLDKFGNITGEKLAKRNFFGLGKQANISDNARKAFERLSNRNLVNMDFPESIDAIRRGGTLKRLGVGLGLEAIRETVPQVKNVISAVNHTG
jgi:hypothetical protein